MCAESVVLDQAMVTVQRAVWHSNNRIGSTSMCAESVVLDPAIQCAVGHTVHRIGSGTGQAPYRWETKHVRVSSKALSKQYLLNLAISVLYQTKERYRLKSYSAREKARKRVCHQLLQYIMRYLKQNEKTIYSWSIAVLTFKR